MARSPSTLTGHLCRRIAQEGALSFSAFMQEALYHPQFGYYSDPERRIGRSGDFYTSVSVGSVFGTLLAATFASMWEVLGRPAEWRVAEQGAHDGRLAADALAALRADWPMAFSGLRWRFLEDRPAWRERQRQTLESADLAAAAEWAEEHSAPATGVFFSNELADALPFDIVVFRAGAWHERRVDWDPSTAAFVWTEVPASKELTAHADVLGIPRLDGWTAEVPGAAREWTSTWSRSIARGFSLTLDYGDAGPEFYTPQRVAGTYRAYVGHRLESNVLQAPGTRDITAHVPFHALAAAAREDGWEVLGWCDQCRFLTAAAETGGWLDRISQALAQPSAPPEATAALRQFRTLSHPSMMGRAFHVLVMSRGLDGCAADAIHGLKYRRPFPE